MAHQQAKWEEENSVAFINYGRYFVPDREQQIQSMCDLIPAREVPFVVMELAHGEGVLAEAVLQQYPQAIVHGYDISTEMRRAAGQKLARFGDRFHTHYFDLAESDWRAPDFKPQAIITSLTVHHLDGAGKRKLFADMFRILADGGALIIADLIEPAGELAHKVAAKGWDTAVKECARKFDGNEEAFAAFEKLEWNLFRHPDPDFDKPSGLFEQLTWLAEAGFTAVDVYWLRAGHAIFGGVKE